MKPAEAIVVGGGPGGSVAALLLRAIGWRVTVLEREPTDRLAAGAGILLQPNGLAVLYGLGMREELTDRGVQHRSAPFYDQRGAVLATAEMPDFGDGLDHALALSRSALAEVLAGALDRAGIEVAHGQEVRDADTRGGLVRIGEGAEHAATLLVGADGVGSQVRRAGDFGARVTPTGHRYARMIVEDVLDMPGAEAWTSLGLFGSAPIDGSHTYAFASATDPEVADALHDRDLEAFVAVWSRVLPSAAPILERIRSVDDILVNAVVQVRCRRLVDGRTALIGDAAHAMAPNLGQGANSAFVDAVALARAVRDAERLESALDRYDRNRRRAVASVQRKADLLARAAHLRGERVRRVRDRLVRTMDHSAIPTRQARAAQQVDPALLFREVRDLGPAG